MNRIFSERALLRKLVRRRREARSSPLSKKGSDWWARGLSLFSICLTVAGLYFSNFYKPEDLTATVRVEKLSQLGTSELNLAIALFNAGKHEVPIESLRLIFLYGSSARMEDITSWQVEGQLMLREMAMSKDWSEPPVVRMKEGSELSVYAPTKLSLNNVDQFSKSTLIEAERAAILAVRFEPAPIDILANRYLAYALAIRYFDRQGTPRLKILPLGAVRTYPDHPDIPGVFFNPAIISAKLLPFNEAPLTAETISHLPGKPTN